MQLSALLNGSDDEKEPGGTAQPGVDVRPPSSGGGRGYLSLSPAEDSQIGAVRAAVHATSDEASTEASVDLQRVSRHSSVGNAADPPGTTLWSRSDPTPSSTTREESMPEMLHTASQAEAAAPVAATPVRSGHCWSAAVSDVVTPGQTVSVAALQQNAQHFPTVAVPSRVTVDLSSVLDHEAATASRSMIVATQLSAWGPMQQDGHVTTGAPAALPAAAAGDQTWQVAWDEASRRAYWYAPDGQTKWIDTPNLVTPEGFLLGGHGWLGQSVCRFYPAHGFAFGEISCWQPPTSSGEPPLWRMQHDDGDNEDLDEAEVVAAIDLAKQVARLPGAWATVGAAVEVNWSVDKRWYPAQVAAVTEQEVTVIYPADPQSGGQMTKDVIPQTECVPSKLRARTVEAKQRGKRKSSAKTSLKGRKANAQSHKAMKAAKLSVATRTVPGQRQQQQRQQQPPPPQQQQQPQQQRQRRPQSRRPSSRLGRLNPKCVDPNAAFAALDNDLLSEMLSKLDAQNLALCARVCRRLRLACMDNSLWSPILQQNWHWGSIFDARKRSGARCDAVLYSATHRRVETGKRLLLRYPSDPAADNHKQESWVLGVVHGFVPGCFLVDWPSYAEDQDSVVDFRNQPMDLRRERMRLRLSFPPEKPPSNQAAIGTGVDDAANASESDAEGDIDDEDVLTEDQIGSLQVGSVIRVWEGRWDRGVIRACNVMAHRVTLLGDGETPGSISGGIGSAGIQTQEPAQNEHVEGLAANFGQGTGFTVAAVAATGVAGNNVGSGGGGTTDGRLVDLALFASRGKLRFADDVRPTGGSAILSTGERQHQLAQWQFGLGDLVWARLKPYPPWPAVISCNPKSCAWRRGDQYRQVVFFGDYTHRAMPVGDLVAFNRSTLQSFSNSGWQSTSSKQVGQYDCSGAVDTGRKTAQDRLRQKAIDSAFRKFFLPIEQGRNAKAL